MNFKAVAKGVIPAVVWIRPNYVYKGKPPYH